MRESKHASTDYPKMKASVQRENANCANELETANGVHGLIFKLRDFSVPGDENGKGVSPRHRSLRAFVYARFIDEQNAWLIGNKLRSERLAT